MTVINLSPEGTHQLKQEEALRLKAYYCSAGKLTIGYGHVLHPGEPRIITKAQAEELLETDVNAREKALKDLEKLNLKQHEIDALIIFVYNIGIDAWNHSTAKRFLLAGNRKDVPAQMKRWVHDDNGKVIEGLNNRQRRTADLFAKGVYAWSV